MGVLTAIHIVTRVTNFGIKTYVEKYYNEKEQTLIMKLITNQVIFKQLLNEYQREAHRTPTKQAQLQSQPQSKVDLKSLFDTINQKNKSRNQNEHKIVNDQEAKEDEAQQQQQRQRGELAFNSKDMSNMFPYLVYTRFNFW